MSGSHYAKDRSSFKKYCQTNATIGKNRVIGIETVELEVKRSLRDQSTHTLVLDGVLHVPDVICNGFGPALTGCNQS